MHCVNVHFKLLTLSRATRDLAKKKTNENDLMDILLCGKGDNDHFHKSSCIHGKCNKCAGYLQTLEKFYEDIPLKLIMIWNRWEKNPLDKNRKVIVTKSGNKNILLQRDGA